MLIIIFFKPCKNIEEFKEDSNKHSMLVDNKETNNEEEDETKKHNNKMKRKTDKVNKNS